MRRRGDGWRTARRRIVPQPQKKPIWPLMMWLLILLGAMLVGALIKR
jgi:hypothetical protein